MVDIETKLKEMIFRHEHPIIGVVGATVPLQGYDSYDACILGYELRKAIEAKGSIFTGGVPGVGIDVYQGIAEYCSENRVRDKFFVLFPDTDLEPPTPYFDIAKEIDGSLDVERIGRDLDDRRNYVGAIADLLIVVNGASGTVDEALKALLMGKEILCLQTSGGAAEVLSRLNSGEIEIPLEVDKKLIQPFDSVRKLIEYCKEKHFQPKIKGGG